MHHKIELTKSSRVFRRFLIAVCLFFIILIDLSATYCLAVENDELTPKETIDYHYNVLKSIYNESSYFEESALEKQVLLMVERLFDVSKFATMVLGNQWSKLNYYEQNRFVEALTISLQQKLLKQIYKYSSKGLPELILISQDTKKNFSKLKYLVSGNKGRKEFNVYMLKSSDGLWKISNMNIGKKNLIREYYSLCEKLIDKYSIAYLEAELTGRGYVILEDFEADEIGKLPKEWSWRKSDAKKNKPYRIKEENGNKFLAAEDNGESVILAKDLRWKLKKYPYISFKWRARSLPERGDERFGNTVDSAAGIYIVYKRKLGLIPESVKYVWSTTLPVGSAMRRSGTGKPWMIVAESGEKHLGEWQTFVFNAHEAYKKTFGGNPPETVLGIAILSDANSTHSKAYADYDDIRALQIADADSGINEFLEAE
ncbi:MAG: DUF3047 domain-containing protein [bacterium]